MNKVNKKDLLSNMDNSKPLEKSVTPTSKNNKGLSQSSEQSREVFMLKENKKDIERVVSKEPIAPLTFLSNNRKLIGLKQPQFKEWLRLQYLAFSGSGHFIPTDEAKKQGYMITENEYIVKLKTISKNPEQLVDISITCDGRLTEQGQEFILNLIEKENEVKNNDKRKN